RRRPPPADPRRGAGDGGAGDRGGGLADGHEGTDSAPAPRRDGGLQAARAPGSAPRRERHRGAHPRAGRPAAAPPCLRERSAADGGAPAPVVGEPRTKEYPWMSVAKWRELHEALLARAHKKSKVDLLFLGDSLTEGWRDNAVWQGRYARRGAANFGIGGDTVE